MVLKLLMGLKELSGVLMMTVDGTDSIYCLDKVDSIMLKLLTVDVD